MPANEERRSVSKHEYGSLRQATLTHREELVLRLCAEAGLRAGEITRLTPSSVEGTDSTLETRQFVTVEETNGDTRLAFLPASVAHDFWLYVRSNDIDSEEMVIDVTERRVQMLLREICERAATQTGRTVFEEITPSSLRKYFAQQLLVEEGVDARVVAAVGGWEGVDALLAPLEDPTRAEIAAAFERSTPEDRTGSPRVTTVSNTLFETLDATLEETNRAALEKHVCGHLTDGLYSAAWILDWDQYREQVSVQRHAGENPDRFEGSANTGLVRRSLQIGKPFVGPDDPGPTSETRGRGLLASIPLQHDDTTYGALVVRANSQDAFDEQERTMLAAFGRQIAFVIEELDRKQVLVGGAVLEVTFQYGDGHGALVSLADALACAVDLEGAVEGKEGFLCFVRLRGTPARDALEVVEEIRGLGDRRLVQSTDDGGLLEIELIEDSPLLALTDRGGTVTALTIENGQATVTCELSPDVNLRSIHDELHDQYPSFELRRKQEREATRDPLDSHDTLSEQLTDKQQAVIQAAYHAGYFEWPRGSTAEDLADSMDVSSPTLHNHLRKAQQKLLEHILENG